MPSQPLVYREVKGAPLTFTEGDDNIRALATGSVESLSIDTINNRLVLNRYDNVYPFTQSISLYSASVVSIGATPQVNPTTGSLWWDTNDGNLYVYYYYDSGGFSGSTWLYAT
jgi:hypothetical protein